MACDVFRAGGRLGPEPLFPQVLLKPASRVLEPRVCLGILSLCLDALQSKAVWQSSQRSPQKHLHYRSAPPLPQGSGPSLVVPPEESAVGPLTD